MRAQRSPGVKIVISRNRWDNLGGNLNGEVGLQERFSKSRLDFHQPPHKKMRLFRVHFWLYDGSDRDHRAPKYMIYEPKGYMK